ncbi:hypothetical protein H6F87_02245 [Cyanobacteria bacterium FACHB-502]|nr:hypothetical protein [Cyanobacteria bacterium FACHB-502]
MNYNMMLKAAIATLSTTILAGELLLPKPAQANSYTEQVARQLVEATILAGHRNIPPTHEPQIQTLRDGRSSVMTLNLRSGASYRLVGVCDADCADLDLKLYDQNGNLISSDIAADSTPIISVVPRWSGQFYLQVDMANCQANYCYYGIGVFGQ